MNPRIRWLSTLPTKYLVISLAMNLLDKLKLKKRFEWTVYEVSHSIFPDSDARNYYDGSSIEEYYFQTT